MKLLMPNSELDRRLKEWPIQIFKMDHLGVYLAYPATGVRPDRTHILYWSNGYHYVIEYYSDVLGQYPAKFLL